MMFPLNSPVEIVDYLWYLWEEDWREYLHPEDFVAIRDPYFFFATDCKEQLQLEVQNND